MSKIVISLLLLILFQIASFAQVKQGQNTDDQEKGSNSLEETLTRAAIEREEAKQRKLVAAAEELNTLAQEIFKSAQGQNQLSGENQKKLGKIEKLAKQVRSDQGGEGGDENLADPPNSLGAALERLQQAADEIEKESCKLTRHGVSVTLIERTNEVLALTKTIKKMGTK